MLVITFTAHTLALLLGIGSLSFYMAAFFYPEVSRPRDVVWSALGLLYALLLWVCAAQMTAAILLGQAIATVLLGVLGTQTLSIRREKTPVYQQTPVVITPEVASNWAKNKINQLRIAPTEPVPLKLEKRSLDEFSSERLGIPIDPRRRPVSEYEFVEDGLWDEAGDEAIASEQLSLSLSEEMGSEEMGSAESGRDEEGAVAMTPPSAIADIISVEAPEELDTSADTKASDSEAIAETIIQSAPREAESVEQNAAEEGPAKEETAGEETAEKAPEEELVEKGHTPEREPVTTSLKETEASREAQTENPSAEAERIVIHEETSGTKTGKGKNPSLAEQVEEDTDWDDSDWIEDNLAEQSSFTEDTQPPSARAVPSKSAPSDPANRVSPSKKEKPSLFAMPVIFASWVKDVVTSMTQPKPAKPVIEIPRREPSIPRPSAEEKEMARDSRPISQSASQPAPQPASQSAPQPTSQSASAETNWDEAEESNWDD